MSPALDALRNKLKKYYALTNAPFVYPNAIIFEPRGKLGFFEKLNFSNYGAKFAPDAYSRRCRERFVKHYERVFRQPPSINAPSSTIPTKRSHSEIDNEWEDMLKLIASTNKNEYDRYIKSQESQQPIPPLQWWKQHGSEYSILSLMVRDTLAVLATGAGVERQFSRSGRVVTPLRHCLQPDSVHEIMMYKNHLSRKYQKELVLFEDAGAMVVEEGKLETEVEPPHLREWKDQWWKERKRRNRL